MREYLIIFIGLMAGIILFPFAIVYGGVIGALKGMWDAVLELIKIIDREYDHYVEGKEC